MKQTIWRALPFLLSLPALAAGAGSAADENPVGNPGFESVAGGKPVGWQCATGWSGEVRSVAGGGRARAGLRAVELRTEFKNRRHWARILGGTLPVAMGLRHRFSVYARGGGEVRLGVIHYRERSAAQPHYVYTWQEQPVALDDQWRQIAFEFAAPDDAVRMALTIELEGENRVALFDDAELQTVRAEDGELVVAPYRMVPVGVPVDVPVTVRRRDGRPMAGAALAAARHAPDGAVTRERLTLDAQGRAVCKVAAPHAAGLVRIDFAQADVGRAGTAHVDAVDPAVHERFRQAARQAKLGADRCHLLFLGDSLTDFLRGQNYVDQVGFWLNEAGAGAVTCRNAGVGGDTIARVWQRLGGEPGVHRPGAYGDLYRPRPDRVFVMLGHNDSKLSSTSGFTEPYVPRDEFRDLYGKVIARVKRESGCARFTVLSSTSSVYEITRPRADASLAAGRAANLFGKPDVMEAFNALAREAAAAEGADYLDLYAPTRDHPAKPTLFTADGVHLSLEGNHVVALEILRSLGR